MENRSGGTSSLFVQGYDRIRLCSRIRILRSFQISKKRDLRFYRAMPCIRGRLLAMGLCPSVSVCLSVCLSQAGVLLKRQNVGLHKQHHTIPQGLSFLMPKISAKFDRSHPLRGRRMQVGWVKIGDFRHISGYISKTVKDRHKVSIKVE